MHIVLYKTSCSGYIYINTVILNKNLLVCKIVLIIKFVFFKLLFNSRLLFNNTYVILLNNSDVQHI